MNETIFDESVLLCWQEVDDANWMKIVIEITDSFFDLSVRQEKDLKRSWQERNIDGVRRTAHILKSTCGNVGAGLAFSTLDKIEKFAEIEDAASIEDLMAEFEPIFVKSRLAVADFLKKHRTA